MKKKLNNNTQQEIDIKQKKILSDFSIMDRWGPLVNNSSGYNLSPPKRAMRTLASVACLILLFVFLWVI